MPAGRVPPHDLGAEKAILGAILIKNALIDDAIDAQLNSDDFFDPAHQTVYEAMLELHETKMPIDLVTLSSRLRARQVFESVGGTARLTAIFEESFSAGRIEAYLEIVRDRAQVRRMMQAGAEIAQEGYEAPNDPEAYLRDCESRIFAISERRSGKTFATLGESLVDAVKVIEERALRPDDLYGLRTGFREVDRLTGGLHPGQVTVLAARPGMGKTSFALNVAYNAAALADAKVAVFSLEMSTDELAIRILSSVTRIDSKRLKSGRLMDRDWRTVAQAADQMSRCGIHIDQTPGITAFELGARARRLKRAQGGLDLIVIDYLQLMAPPKALQRGNVNETQQIAQTSKAIKELAKELECPVLLLSQLNRAGESDRTPDKRPSLANLRGSGAIEQDADAVVFIHRPGYYDKNCDDPNLAELIWAKNRHGEPATVKAAYIGQYTLFTDIDEDRAVPG